jgi:hypothetical protein
MIAIDYRKADVDGLRNRQVQAMRVRHVTRR